MFYYFLVFYSGFVREATIDCRELAKKRLSGLGFKLTYGRNIYEGNGLGSSSVESRIEDLHEAFRDKNVNAILTVIGGYNSNQMLDYIDYKLIKKNPKIICGFSDITALGGAVLAKTGLVTHNGPHFSSWGMKYGFDYSEKYFTKCLMEDKKYEIEPSDEWSDDPWFLDQKNREFIKNEGYWVINKGEVEGRLIGVHGRCLAALQGMEYWSGFDGSILIIEEDEEVNPGVFDRIIQSFIHLPDFKGVKGIIIGRFQKNSNIDKDTLEKIIKTKKELNNIPVIANVDVGHTAPLATWPVGGKAKISAKTKNAKINIIEH